MGAAWRYATSVSAPSGSHTLTIDADEVTTSRGSSHLGLMLAWGDDPARVGEVAPVRAPALLGRGGPRSSDPLPRLGFFRRRPGASEPRAPLDARWLSRVQLRVQPDDGALELENVGRAELEHDGLVARTVRLQPGDACALGGRMVLLCVRLEPLADLEARHPFGGPDASGLVGEGATAWELRRSIAFAAPRAAHVLVRGESGTGKELVGRALHAASDRSRGPFVARNAATVPEGLFDAELFGHAANYPQAGMAAREGLVGAADGGTLFLDEFAELPPGLQPHLLRVLDDGEYQRLGESRARHVDLRLVAATNRPASDLRDDLLARFALRIRVPPLQERREDLPLLLRHVLDRILDDEPDLGGRFRGERGPRVDARLVLAVLQRDWTTHVRELEALLWQALAASPGDTVLLPPPSPDEDAPDWEAWRGTDPRDLPAEVVQACLDAHNGAQTETAEALGLSSRHVLARLIKRHELTIRRS